MSSVDGAPRKRSIPCVYCAGEHESAAELKECWQRSQGKEAVPTDELPPLDSYDDGEMSPSQPFETAAPRRSPAPHPPAPKSPAAQPSAAPRRVQAAVAHTVPVVR
ncbi:MAG: hypothetical protein WCC60_02760, partial [Ilumatobacteraceae bacterium]